MGNIFTGYFALVVKFLRILKIAKTGYSFWKIWFLGITVQQYVYMTVAKKIKLIFMVRTFRILIEVISHLLPKSFNFEQSCVYYIFLQ